MSAEEAGEPLLRVELDGAPLCTFTAAELPCEKKASGPLQAEKSSLVFRQPNGSTRTHTLSFEKGWGHFSVRVHENLACQADCVISDSSDFDPGAFLRGEVRGIRFQPQFLHGAAVGEAQLKGQSLFTRGLHFSGTVSPGNLSLSCICDSCGQCFRLQSFHAGFAQVGYFYSGSGRFTLVVPQQVKGSPVPTQRPLSQDELMTIATLEARLPDAPDGTRFSLLNPLRCPHCSAPYIDFAAHPELRPREYYGNSFFGQDPLSFEDTA